MTTNTRSPGRGSMAQPGQADLLTAIAAASRLASTQTCNGDQQMKSSSLAHRMSQLGRADSALLLVSTATARDITSSHLHMEMRLQGGEKSISMGGWSSPLA